VTYTWLHSEQTDSGTKPAGITFNCDYVKRKMYKNRTFKVVNNRNEQFEYIAKLKDEFTKENLSMLSIDTKKKRCWEISIEMGNYLQPNQ
jgi:hypothetical protein